MDLQQIVDLINKYGFPIVAAVGMGYFIYFIYAYVTTTLAPLIREINTTLVALIDRIRMLDNEAEKITGVSAFKIKQVCMFLND